MTTDETAGGVSNTAAPASAPSRSFAARKPRRGQRILVNARVSGATHVLTGGGGDPVVSTPWDDGGGTYATYHGVTNGYSVVQGPTSDYTFLASDTLWRTR